MYDALREEILEHMRRNGQILALTVLALGTLIAAGVQFHNAALVLIYPIIATSLAFMWVAEDQGIEGVGAYIREKIEKPLQTKQYVYWEHWIAGQRLLKLRYRITLLIFYVSSEAVSLIIAGYMSADIENALGALAVGHYSPFAWSPDTLLFALALIGILVTLIILGPRAFYIRRARKSGTPRTDEVH
jgi:uncharacterized membrane protein YphA (DoxX/SURF4 family)